MESFLENTRKFVPQEYGYEFTLWEKVLAAEFVSGSLNAIEGLGEQEYRDLFLYNLLWNCPLMDAPGRARRKGMTRIMELRVMWRLAGNYSIAKITSHIC